MAYIGQRPVVGRYIKLDQISSGFNGSNTDFNMTAGSQAVFPGTARNLLLSLGGVIQEPDTDFTISGSTLTFTTPPVSNTTFFGVIYGDMQAIGTPSDGTVLPISIASSGNFTFPEITLTGDLTIPDKLIHSGDTDTSIRFPSNNTISAQTAGSEAIRITDGQKFLIGSTSMRDVGGGSAQSVFQIEGTSQNRSSISLISNQASASPASLRLGKTRGTSVGSVTAVTDGDSLGQIRFVGSDGTDLENTTAMVLGVVDGSVSGNTIPTAIAFETSLTNGSSRAERMRITSSGNVGIGTTSPDFLLEVENESSITGDAEISLKNTNTGGGSDTILRFKVAGTTQDNFIYFGDSGSDTAGSIQYNHSSDLLKVSVNSAERLRIISDGKVGIGTTTPGAKLAVVGTSGALTGQFIQGADTVSDRTIIAQSTNGNNLGAFVDGSNIRHLVSGQNDILTTDGNFLALHTSSGTERLRIISTGFIGIGTASPQTHLVLRAGNPQFTLEPTANTQTCRLQFCLTDGTIKTSIQGGGSLDSALRVVQNSTEVLRIDTSGRVGIGTSTPETDLSVDGVIRSTGTAPNISMLDTNADADNKQWDFKLTGSNTFTIQALNDSGAGGGNLFDMTRSGNSIETFNGKKSGVVWFTVDNNARMLTTRSLTVSVDAQVSGRIVVANNSAAFPSYSFTNSNTTGFYRHSSNQIGVSIAGAAEYRFTNGQFGALVTDANDLGSNNHRWDDVFLMNNPNVSSDKNLKNTIVTSDLGLDFINKLNPVSYKYNGKTRTHYGLIAQEIETVLNTISKSTTDFAGFCKDEVDDDGNSITPAYSLRYSEFISPIIKAIQELSTKVAALEAA